MKNKYLTHVLPIAMLSIVGLVAILYLVNIYQWSHGPFFGWGYRPFSGETVVGRVYNVSYEAGLRVGDKILEVNEKPVKDLAGIRESLNKGIGAINRLIVLRNREEYTINFRTARYGLGRSILDFGVSWLIGIIIIGIGSFVFFTTSPLDNKRWSFFFFCICAGLFMIFFSPKSLWPSWIQSFQLIGYCFLPATILHMSIISPFYGDDNPQHILYTGCIYTFSFLLFMTIIIFFGSLSAAPKYFRLIILSSLFLSFLTLIIVLFYQYRKTASRLIKLKIKVILIGFFISLLLPMVEPIFNSLFSIFIFPSIELATLPFIPAFPLSIGYAIIKHDLFEIDVFIKRATGYLLSTGSIALFYFLFIFSANHVLAYFVKDSSFQSQHILNLIFILIIFFLFNPLTNKLQDFINKIFYRRKYDYKEPVKQLLKDLSSIFKLDLIIERLLNILSNTIFIENIQFFLLDTDQGKYLPYDPHLSRINNNSALSIPSSSSLVKILLEEKKEIHRDSLSALPKYAHLKEEILSLFESWKALLLLPLITHDKMSGFISLGQMKSGRHYTMFDIEFLRIIAYQIAIALENVTLFQDSIEKEKIKEELKIAGAIQRRMLPDESPQIKNISIHASITPSWEIGGDFYDFIEIPSGEEKTWGIIMGDVSGHGISGALLSSAAHSICQNQVLLQKDAASVMGESNRLLVKETKKKAFVALVFALLLPDKRLIITNAGQPAPLYYNEKRKEIRFLENEGERFPLGMIDDPSYIPLTFSPEEGDVILCYTDGIVEAKDKEGERELFGYDRLTELFSRLVYLEPEEIANRIITEVRQFSGINRFEDDDMTIIILKYIETHPLDTVLTLPVSSGSMGMIIQGVRSLAGLSRLDEETIAQLEAEVKKMYLLACDQYKLLSDCKLVISLSQDRIESIEQSKGVRGGDDRYYLELLPRDGILTTFNSSSINRLIVNFSCNQSDPSFGISSEGERS